MLVRPVRCLEIKPETPDWGGLDTSKEGTVDIKTARMDLPEETPRLDIRMYEVNWCERRDGSSRRILSSNLTCSQS